MSQFDYIKNLLNIKDKNIIIKNVYEEKEKGLVYKAIDGILSYTPTCCERCGCIYNKEQTYEKNGFRESKILLLDVSGYKCKLKLKKQRFLCHSCHKKFFAKTNIVNSNCFISNNVKYSIALELKNKISEKDISKRYRVSSNTVERIIDSYYEPQKIYKNYLPEILSFDEFKSVKSADGAMSFHMVNGKTGKTIDIVENRQLNNLINYFGRYSHKSRSNVKIIVIDMYSPYVSLIKKMFPNANIIIDKFHLVNLISTSLNKTRINAMKNDKKNYNKFKNYWRLLLKNEDEIDNSKWKKWKCFDDLMTQADIVDYLVNTNEELKNTYELYQTLLHELKNNQKDKIEATLNKKYNNISSYMKTSLKTLREFLPYIKNTLSYPYHNGFVEGNNNFIKVLKRIAFGFRSFRRFKARIMICKNLLHMKKVSVC